MIAVQVGEDVGMGHEVAARNAKFTVVSRAVPPIGMKRQVTGSVACGDAVICARTALEVRDGVTAVIYRRDQDVRALGREAVERAIIIIFPAAAVLHADEVISVVRIRWVRRKARVDTFHAVQQVTGTRGVIAAGHAVI